MATRSMTPEHQPSTGASSPILNDAMVQEQIAKKAYELWEQRGRVHGHDVEDWLTAAQMVLDESATQKPQEPLKPTMPKSYQEQRSRIQSDRKRSEAIVETTATP
jgi:Protein of unknown function (DUF2934)